MNWCRAVGQGSYALLRVQRASWASECLEVLPETSGPMKMSPDDGVLKGV
jgi:hypothetical protein